MLRLPLDLSTFSILRTSNYLYVDKTRHAYNLITQGRRYFLSRPRRFGKSLLVSMLQEVLTGNKVLFDDLWIAKSNYSWPEHGVIMLDFSRMGIQNKSSFEQAMHFGLQKTAEMYGIQIDSQNLTPQLLLYQLVHALHSRFGKVAILVDEYDSAVLHSLHEPEQAKEIRSAMQQFFTAIKGLDQYIDFVFITGVSSFTKAGLFSGINNLSVITLDAKYADICGYTQEEVDVYFAPYIAQWSLEKSIPKETLYEKIKEYYNGYAFGDVSKRVYNPFSLMHALDRKLFKNFWFRSGTPNFLVSELSKEYRQHEYTIFDPETFRVSEELLESFDVGTTPLPALMFQSGYLTVRSFDEDRDLYSLGYPNAEVQQSMQKYLVAVFTQHEASTVEKISSDLEAALSRQHIDEAIILLKRLFMHVPYQLHVKEEKFYHALLHMVCNAYGMKVVSEQPISHGRIDMVISVERVLYVIEIKFNETPEKALEQIEKMHYYEPLLKDNKHVVLLGLSFNRTEKHFDITYAYKTLR